MKQPLGDFVPTRLEMTGDVAQNPGQSAHLQGIMEGNSDVVLPVLVRGKPKMTSGLPGGLVSELLKMPGEFSARNVAW